MADGSIVPVEGNDPAAILARLSAKASKALQGEYKDQISEEIAKAMAQALAQFVGNMHKMSASQSVIALGILIDKWDKLTGGAKKEGPGIGQQINIQVNGVEAGKGGLIERLIGRQESNERLVSPSTGHNASTYPDALILTEDQGVYGQSDKVSAVSPGYSGNASNSASKPKPRKSLRNHGSKGGGGGQQIAPS